MSLDPFEHATIRDFKRAYEVWITIVVVALVAFGIWSVWHWRETAPRDELIDEAEWQVDPCQDRGM